MELKFYKYQGTGNDFVILDGWEGLPEISSDQVKRLCDRRFGIGADGLMIISKSVSSDFLMRYYNADGRLGSMCGNGGRCLVQFAYQQGYIGSATLFTASDGLHKATIIKEKDWVSLQMSDVTKVDILDSESCYLNTGSPHFIKWVNAPDSIDVVKEGRVIRNSDDYIKEGVNVNFVEVLQGRVVVRTYERGVEDETLSCGTGVTASVLAAAYTNKIKPSIGSAAVLTKGGELIVKFNMTGNSFNDIWLEGPAEFVYYGSIELL